MIFAELIHTVMPLFHDALVGKRPFERASIGFTGSREGPTREQMNTWERFAAHLVGIEMHNGCAVGADRYVVQHAPAHCSFTFWPANMDGFLWAREHPGHNLVRDIREPLVRNKLIVSSTHGLIAMPITVEEVQRSGTWATIRHARRLERPIIRILPNGHLVLDGSIKAT